MKLKQLQANISIAEVLKLASLEIENSQALSFQVGQLEARILFEHCTGQVHTWLLLHQDEAVSALNEGKWLDEYISCVEQRVKGKPLAFIMGYQEFWTLKLKVADCTLIPRQDTETLVEQALSLKLPTNAKVLDLGTGTGAIALSLAKERPNWDVFAYERVAEALELAKENAMANNLKVNFYQSDWFSILDKAPKEIANIDFDLIVSNPPYVELNSEYIRSGHLKYEPLSALVAKDDGLSDLKHIISNAPQYLQNNAYLLLEHGFEQGAIVRELLASADFTEVRTIEDLNHLPRCSIGRFSY